MSKIRLHSMEIWLLMFLEYTDSKRFRRLKISVVSKEKCMIFAFLHFVGLDDIVYQELDANGLEQAY